MGRKPSPKRDDQFIIDAKAKGWSNRQIAKALDVSHHSVNKWYGEIRGGQAIQGGSPRKLPSGNKIAELMRDGLTQKQIAQVYNVRPNAVWKQVQGLRAAGISITGATCTCHKTNGKHTRDCDARP